MGKIAVTSGVFVVVLILLVGGGAIAVVQAVFGSSRPGVSCAPAGASTTSAAGYGPQEMSNAAIIVAVGQRMNVPEQGWVIAVTTAITESRLQNLNYGDRDSVGLFQQRPSQGWGTVAQIMDPSYSSEQFYRHLTSLPNWQRMSVTEAAQTVQRSGFPDRYAQFEQAARQVIGAVQGIPCTPSGTGDCAAIQAPNPTVMAALNFACGQRGLRYVWGGNGPRDGGFDCSGLTKAAYAAAGISLPRTAQLQYNAGPRVSAGDHIQPGDLVFFGTSGSAVTHVGIAVTPTTMVNAPDFGQPIQVSPLGRNLVGVTRPAPPLRQTAAH
ncbi:C40 family peptidase [Amycolatopsis sp. NPDC059021]|uniref:C40 family peptidase n=1 Tax=Amycolatopsis sp. NPDC059021 TaxID=3346704 RepID=UPI00366FF86B